MTASSHRYTAISADPPPTAPYTEMPVRPLPGAALGAVSPAAARRALPAARRARDIPLGLLPIGLDAAIASLPAYRDWWRAFPWFRPVEVAIIVSITTSCWGGLAMIRRRPHNRCGWLAVAGGVVLAGYYLLQELAYTI